MLATSQIIMPAGMVKAIARQRTRIVLSINDVYNVCKIRGGLYGGNSKLKVDAWPLKIDLLKPHDTKRLKTIPPMKSLSPVS